MQKRILFIKDNQDDSKKAIKAQESSTGTNKNRRVEEIQTQHLSNPNAIIFSLKNQVTGLVRALRIFQEYNINVRHIESRKSRRKNSQYEIYLDIDCEDKDKMNQLLHQLRYLNLNFIQNAKLF